MTQRSDTLGRPASMIVDLFAGPGGWDEGLRGLGYDGTVVGLEWDEAACLTRSAAGHLTIRADVADYPRDVFDDVDGLIGSPPCQSFSKAGKRRGLDDSRGALVWQPRQWALGLRPRWVALEQVPEVLPLWRDTAESLHRRGYSTWCGILNAADYGVPQTRQRAILIARLDADAQPPAPTHAKEPEADLFGPALLPWVSMFDALPELGDSLVGFPRRDDRGDSPHGYRERDLRRTDEPAFTVTEKARSWTQTRPATTVQGDPRIWPPGHKVNAGDRARLGEEEANRRYGDRAGTEAIRVTQEQALTLQGFRPDYPVVGSKTKRFEQIGNAIPPPLAAAILREVIK